MRRIYLRIFLSFWLAMVLIIASAIGVTAMIASYRISRLQSVTPSHLVDGASVALRSGGSEGLQRWLKAAAESRPELDLYVIDARGADILNRRIPKRIEPWIALSALQQAQHQQTLNTYGYAVGPHGLVPEQTGRLSRSHLLANPVLRSPDGTTLQMVIAWFGATPYDVLGSRSTISLVFLIAVAVSAGICWWIARYIAQPVAKLQESARALTLGALDAQVDPRVCARQDELGRLARDFNEMATRLRSQISSKETLIRDISHELRSPLTRLRVTLALAQQGEGDVGRQLERIERDIERLDALIEDTLQFSRLSSGEPGLTEDEIDIAELVEDVAADTRLEAAASRKEITVSGMPHLTVRANALLLRRALDNVLRNAVRFTPDGTTVEVSARETKDHHVVVVRDHGPGVPEADRQRIFEAFYRVNEARDRISGGAGLGLAITARVMAVHGGHAQARNAPGGGLLVELSLPEARLIRSHNPTDHDVLWTRESPKDLSAKTATAPRPRRVKEA